MLTSCTRCSTAVLAGPPEKANNTFSPSLISLDFPKADLNLCVQYAKKHSLNKELIINPLGTLVAFIRRLIDGRAYVISMGQLGNKRA